jgi:iron complex transport system ATP-binding protein
MKSWSMYSNEDIKIVEEILELVSLSDKAYRYINTLSGGERRRVAVATLIVQSPMIWLLDEPTNHLDMHYQISMLDLLIERVEKSNGALLMVLHDVNLLMRYCTHAILMIDSNKIITGKVEEVINRENLQILYNHPIKQITDNNKQMFFPA